MVSFCYLYKVRTCNIYKRISFIMKQLLPLTHHAKKLIIQNDEFHIYLALHDSSEFLYRHLKTAVADNSNNSSVRRTKLCADRCRKCKTHCSQSTGGDITFRLIKFCIAAGYHLVLTNIGHYDCITFCKFIQQFYHLTHCECFDSWI